MNVRATSAQIGEVAMHQVCVCVCGHVCGCVCMSVYLSVLVLLCIHTFVM